MISQALPTYSVKVTTPDGDLFVHFIEEKEGVPTEIKLNIGKSGTALSAWANCVAELISLGLRNGISIYQMLEVLCDIKSDKLAHSSQIPIYSGPDGLVQAFLVYHQEKENERYSTGEIEERKSFISRRKETDNEGGNRD